MNWLAQNDHNFLPTFLCLSFTGLLTLTHSELGSLICHTHKGGPLWVRILPNLQQFFLYVVHMRCKRGGDSTFVLLIHVYNIMALPDLSRHHKKQNGRTAEQQLWLWVVYCTLRFIVNNLVLLLSKISSQLMLMSIVVCHQPIKLNLTKVRLCHFFHSGYYLLDIILFMMGQLFTCLMSSWIYII